MITPLALLGVALVPLWAVGAWVAQQLNAVLGALAQLPGAAWIAPVAPLWAQFAGLLGAALLVLPMPWRARMLALPLVLPWALPPRDLPSPGAFEVLALDVGQGTAVLLHTHEHVLVFGAGPQYSSESDTGQRALLPLLRARGEMRADRLVLSHRDLDHVGGAPALLKLMPVDDVLSSFENGHPILALPRDALCRGPVVETGDGVRFDVLRPDPADYERNLKSNAMSCVLRVSTQGAQPRSVLLTGDIEREQEAALVAALPRALRSDVRVVPHDGSKTSSTAAFLDTVRLRVAIFQAGYRNRFSHPAAEVRYAMRSAGSKSESARTAAPGSGARIPVTPPSAIARRHVAIGTRSRSALPRTPIIAEGPDISGRSLA